jgi:hypothetical protein
VGDPAFLNVPGAAAIILPVALIIALGTFIVALRLQIGIRLHGVKGANQPLNPRSAGGLGPADYLAHPLLMAKGLAPDPPGSSN